MQGKSAEAEGQNRLKLSKKNTAPIFRFNKKLTYR